MVSGMLSMLDMKGGMHGLDGFLQSITDLGRPHRRRVLPVLRETGSLKMTQLPVTNVPLSRSSPFADTQTLKPNTASLCQAILIQQWHDQRKQLPQRQYTQTVTIVVHRARHL